MPVDLREVSSMLRFYPGLVLRVTSYNGRRYRRPFYVMCLDDHDTMPDVAFIPPVPKSLVPFDGPLRDDNGRDSIFSIEDDGNDFEPITPEEWPDKVCAYMAKRALL